MQNVFSMDFFDFAEHQNFSKYGLGYKSTFKRKTDIDAINRAAATVNAQYLLRCITCFLPQYTPNITQQRISSKVIVSRASNASHYIERLKDPFFGNM